MQYDVCAHEYVGQWVCIGLPSYGPLTFIDFAQDDLWDRVVDDSRFIRRKRAPGLKNADMLAPLVVHPARELTPAV